MRERACLGVERAWAERGDPGVGTGWCFQNGRCTCGRTLFPWRMPLPLLRSLTNACISEASVGGLSSYGRRCVLFEHYREARRGEG